MDRINATTSNRLAKMSFICALLVVVLHVGIGPKWIGRTLALTGIAVPFFFLAAGYLFAGRMEDPAWYVRQVKSRAKSLLIPYVFWNFAYWSFIVGMAYAFARAGNSYGGRTVIEGLMGGRWDIIGLLPFSFPALGLLWFVRCLIVLVVISPVFSFLKQRWTIALILLGYILFCWWCVANPDPEEGWVRPWLVKGWMKAFLFFAAGIWLRFNWNDHVQLPRWMAVIVLGAGWIFLAYGGTLVWPIGVPFAMIGLWWTISDSAWPKWLTSCSFPIYVLHAFWGVMASAVFSALGLKGWADNSAVAWLLKWILMAGGSIVSVLILRKFFARISGFIFGGR